MELNKEHREQLICELKNTLEEINRAKRIIEIYKQRNENKSVIHFKEIEIFLNEEKIKTIQSALINNEIDF